MPRFTDIHQQLPPDADTAAQVHPETHGMAADDVHRVEPGPAAGDPGDSTGGEQSETIVGGFLRALVERDFASVSALLAPQMRFRALVPPGLREANDADGATTWLRAWFGSSPDFEVLDAGHEVFAGRHHIWYRFALDREGRKTVIHQDGFCDVVGVQITDLSLLCSGFRPAASARSDPKGPTKP